MEEKGLIKSISQFNVWHGDAALVEVLQNDETKYLLFDIGDENYSLADFKKKINPESPNHTQAFFTHMHADHIGCFNELLKMHDEKRIVLDKVFINLSVLQSSKILEVLDRDVTDVDFVKHGDNRQDCLNAVAYASLVYGKENDAFKELVENINIKRGGKRIEAKEIEERAKSIKEKLIEEKLEQLAQGRKYEDFLAEVEKYEKIKKSVKELKEYYAKHPKEMANSEENLNRFWEYKNNEKFLKDNKAEYNANKKFIKDYGEAEKNVTKEIRKLFSNIQDLKKRGVEVLTMQLGVTNKTFDAYGVKVNSHTIDKEIFKEYVSSLVEAGELEEKMGLKPEGTMQSEQVKNYLVKHCAMESKVFNCEDKRKREGQESRRIIAKVCSGEPNQSNVTFKVSDENIEYVCSGDMEFPQELMCLAENFDLSCHLYKKAHHDAETSNFPNTIEKVINDTLNNIKDDLIKDSGPIFVVSSSLSDVEKYKKSAEREEKLGISSFKTIDGTFTMNVDEKTKEIYVHTPQVKEFCESKASEAREKGFGRALSQEEFNTLRGEIDKYEKYKNVGLPLGEFQERFMGKQLDEIMERLVIKRDV